eukprot:SAG11_NODE_20205_length_450_cov_1.444444_1_plen_24_part_01
MDAPLCAKGVEGAGQRTVFRLKIT